MGARLRARQLRRPGLSAQCFVFDPDRAASCAWQTEDWDPALRFWTLALDPNLGVWLQDQDTSQVLDHGGARVRARSTTSGASIGTTLKTRGWLLDSAAGVDSTLTRGRPSFAFIKNEIAELFELMEDDRDRYLAEINAQADGLAAYFIAFLGVDGERRPWTIELIRCGLAIGNIVYMHYKRSFAACGRRASAPGLVPPFGPPRHPSFPSGHSFLGHFIALLLLEIPEVADVFGEPDSAGVLAPAAALATSLGTASRASRGRCCGSARGSRRTASGSACTTPRTRRRSRWLAGAIWALLTKSGSIADAKPPAGSAVTLADFINCPSLDRVIRMAKTEWAVA